MSLFRYFGNKTSMIKHYKSPPKGTKRIVEPFAGSMGYSFYYDLDKLGIEINNEVYNLYIYLLDNGINKLNKLYEYIKQQGKDKFDARELDIVQEERTYLTLNCCLMKGALGKNIFYINFLDGAINNTVRELRNISKKKLDVNVINGSCFEVFTEKDVREGDLIFIDPPYESSTENYGIEESQTCKIIDYVERLRKTGVPIIFVYGDNAPELFPGYDWKEVCIKKTSPIKNKLKVRFRMEYVVYINFSEEHRLLDII